MGTFERLLRARVYLHGIMAMAPEKRSTVERLALKYGHDIYYRVMSRRFGAEIGIEAKIGDGLKLLHNGHGVFIAGTALIGKHATIMQHVTIGVDRKGAPVIGDDVFIGANATIIGACVISDGAKIGAGVTLVDAAIPPGAVIINKSAFNLTEGKPVYF